MTRSYSKASLVENKQSAFYPARKLQKQNLTAIQLNNKSLGEKYAKTIHMQSLIVNLKK